MTARTLALAVLLTWPVQPLDDAVRAAVQRDRTPAMEAPMHAASDFARPVLIAGAGLALLGGAAGRAVVGELVVALVPVNLVVEGLKLACDRRRPDGDQRRSNSSFPSSHTANAFAVAWVVSRRWRRAAFAVVPFAAIVGYSRMYLDRHWFSDVLAGLVLGVAVSAVALYAWRRWRARGANGAPPPDDGREENSPPRAV